MSLHYLQPPLMNNLGQAVSPSLKSPDSSVEVHRDIVQPTVSSTKDDSWEVGMIEKLHNLQTKIDEILECCKSKCLEKNNTVREVKQLKTVKMVLPVRKCVPCPCPSTPTTCPIVPADHCPCGVQIGQLLPCPIAPGKKFFALVANMLSKITYTTETYNLNIKISFSLLFVSYKLNYSHLLFSGVFQIRNQRRKRQMSEVIVPLDDKRAIEYLRKLGYVEESSLSPANICHPTNLPANILSPDEVVTSILRTAALAPIPIQSFQGALAAHQQIPIQLLANYSQYIPAQQSLLGGISGVQPMNFALLPQQQEKQQRLASAGSVEQSKLTDFFASQSGNQLNDACFIFVPFFSFDSSLN
uniref:Uncharacterized protein n=1 Tax=Elaeophora elaphi TaxID=1147741 RepID=A0A0R3RFR4_9BILA